MPTIKEVAERAGVSSTTVSHVINDTRFVSATVREKVLGAMREMDYHPNALARSLRRGETRTLGLILPDSANPFFAEVGRGIERSAFENGYNVILCNTDGDARKEAVYVDVLIEKHVDGVVFVAVGENSDTLHRLLDIDLPVIVVDRDFPGIDVDAVLADNHQGGYIATRHLIDLGHRRIGCIGGPSQITPSADRVTGYRAALADAGIAVSEEMIGCGDFHPASGQSAARSLMELPDPPSAIFVCNDLMAIGALRAAGEKGRRVPEDLAVVGFDDIELASYTNPPLTTVAQPKQEIGQRATQLLIERVLDKSIHPRRESLSMHLAIRGSCGARR